MFQIKSSLHKNKKSVYKTVIRLRCIFFIKFMYPMSFGSNVYLFVRFNEWIVSNSFCNRTNKHRDCQTYYSFFWFRCSRVKTISICAQCPLFSRPHENLDLTSKIAVVLSSRHQLIARVGPQAALDFCDTVTTCRYVELHHAAII